MSEPRSPRSIDRRVFLRQVAGAAAAAALAPAASFAQTPTPAPSATPAPAAATTPAPPSEDAWALTAILQRRLEGRLTPEQWEAVARDFEGDLGVGRRLRAFAMKNSDEPDSTFRV